MEKQQVQPCQTAGGCTTQLMQRVVQQIPSQAASTGQQAPMHPSTVKSNPHACINPVTCSHTARKHQHPTAPCEGVVRAPSFQHKLRQSPPLPPCEKASTVSCCTCRRRKEPPPARACRAPHTTRAIGQHTPSSPSLLPQLPGRDQVAVVLVCP